MCGGIKGLWASTLDVSIYNIQIFSLSHLVKKVFTSQIVFLDEKF